MPFFSLTCLLLLSQVVPEDPARAAGAETQTNELREFNEIALEELDQMSLEELLSNVKVSTSAKIERSFEQSPSILAVFTRTELDKIGARQLSDLLPFVPGFFEVASPLDRNFGIRGVHAALSQHFVVLLDGLRLNDALFSSASPDGLSLEHAQRVEIVRGPGSAIYGANALMAVINIITSKQGETGARASISGGLPALGRLDANLSLEAGPAHLFQISGSFWGRSGSRFLVNSNEDVLIPSLGANITDGVQPGENLTQPAGDVSLAVNRYSPSYDVMLKAAKQDDWALRVGAARNDYYTQRTSRQSLLDASAQAVTPEYVKERFLVDFEKRWGKADTSGMLTLRPSFLMFNHDQKSQITRPAAYLEASRQNTPVISGWSGRDFNFLTSIDYLKELPKFWFFSENSLILGTQLEFSVLDEYRTRSCRLDLDSRLPPSIYSRQGGEDLFCAELPMLREGTLVDPNGNVTDTGSPGLGDGDQWKLGAYFQYWTSLPGNVGLLLGGRVDEKFGTPPQVSPRISLVAPLGERLYLKSQYTSSFVYPAFVYEAGNSISDYQGSQGIQPQTIRTAELLVGFKNDFLRTELSASYNHVDNFITFDLDRNARSGQFKFTNQGSLRVLSLESTAQLSLLRGRVGLRVHNAYVVPVGGTSDNFLVDGQLGGATKFPELSGAASLNVSVVQGLNVHLGALYNGPIAQRIPRQAQFQEIPGDDGIVYSSRAAETYRTAAILDRVSVSWTPTEAWTLSVAGSNLFNQRIYRPGSVLIPYLLEGRQVTGTLSYGFR